MTIKTLSGSHKESHFELVRREKEDKLYRRRVFKWYNYWQGWYNTHSGSKRFHKWLLRAGRNEGLSWAALITLCGWYDKMMYRNKCNTVSHVLQFQKVMGLKIIPEEFRTIEDYLKE